MTVSATDWQEAVKFHGHACPGLAMGVRAAQTAMEKLGVSRSGDEELVAIAETDACSADGVQVLTSCTFGKGNFFWKDYGKQAFSVGSRKDGRAVRVYLNPYPVSNAEKELRAKVTRGEATAAEQAENSKLREKMIDYYLYGPEEAVCKVSETVMELPAKARVFQSVPCGKCGEYFMEPRARLEDGQIVCPACFTEYRR